VFVGVYLERSIEAVIAVLGILKAGGAYVHLDPGQPQKRIEELVRDAQPHSIVTTGAMQHTFPQDSCCVDIGASDLLDHDGSNPTSIVEPDDAAYLLYTSGSTGKPKGVVEIHRSLTARLGARHLPDIQPGDICGLSSSFSSGITASRLFLPLVLGNPVVILGETDVKDIRLFVRAIQTNAISSVFLSPAQLRALLELGDDVLGRLACIRAVTVTGTMLTAELIHCFFKSLPSARLVNVYGSTEIGTTAALRVIERMSDLHPSSVGRPLANTRIYLLDENGLPVPAGQAGELYVSAKHLAREYRHQPKLTAERFLNDPFYPGERMYRTGDFGRELPNGEIQFLGRRDDQVKIRGYRVELSEIEVALEEHSGVREAVVTAPGVDPDKRLAAYVTGRVGLTLSISELRRYLRDRLPEYMIPGAFVLLANMPRTSSGKVDRQILPKCDLARPEVDSPFELPRNEVEDGVADIWRETLKINLVSIHDNFVELGGDSLMAVQVMVRLLQRFDLIVTLECLFEKTIAEIAQMVGGECSDDAAS